MDRVVEIYSPSARALVRELLRRERLPPADADHLLRLIDQGDQTLFAAMVEFAP